VFEEFVRREYPNTQKSGTIRSNAGHFYKIMVRVARCSPA
jgi:hypothetical protein